MAEYFLEPQNPLKKIDETTGDINYIYPLTTDKQVIMENGERLNTVLNESILYMGETAEESSAAPVDADTLGGQLPSYYATAALAQAAQTIADNAQSTADTAASNAAAAQSAANAAMPKSGGSFTGAVTYTTLSGGDITSSGSITATGNITGAKVYGAVYNDYAEFFPRGEETEPGDLITLDLNSDEEKYIKATSGATYLGVHTNEYAHLIGGEQPPENEDYVEYNIKRYIPVALAGRVHVKVVGSVRKGDYIVASDVPGIGISGEKQYAVGYCLENNDNPDIKMVKVRVI